MDQHWGMKQQYNVKKLEGDTVSQKVIMILMRLQMKAEMVNDIDRNIGDLKQYRQTTQHIEDTINKLEEFQDIKKA